MLIISFTSAGLVTLVKSDITEFEYKNTNLGTSVIKEKLMNIKYRMDIISNKHTTNILLWTAWSD